MTTSPCCTNFQFPVSDKPLDMAALAMASPLMQPDAEDYFSVPAQQVNTKFVPKQAHKPSAQSISSLASDDTLNDALTESDFHNSTETLVGLVNSSPKVRRNVLLLRLSLSQRSATHVGMASARPFEGFSRIDEELLNQSRSAVDSHFSFHPSSEDTGLFDPAATTLLAPAPVPILHKQLTIPNLLHPALLDSGLPRFEPKRSLYLAPAQNMHNAIVGLSLRIKYLPPAEMAQLLERCHMDPITHLPSVLVIDIRSFADFIRSNVTGSINVCPPLTLLRRTTFNMTKCIGLLPMYERLVFINYLHVNKTNEELNTVFNSTEMGLHGLPPIFIYDNVNTSVNLYNMCKKLVDLSCWDALSMPPIYLLDGCFQEFARQYGHLVSTGKSEVIDLTKLQVSSVEEPTFAEANTMYPLNTDKVRCRRVGSMPSLPTFALDKSTPNVSNFMLPQNLPQKTFKIRHNEEVLDWDTSTFETPLAKLSDSELDALPKWLKHAFTHPDTIKDGFRKLEICEKLRLNNALSLQSKLELLTPGGHTEASPVINCGLDYGHKNRYKDIFLFDHSRVKLQSSSAESDYINASYLKPNAEFLALASGKPSARLLRGLKIIATQGPLQETTGDFWRCVVDEQCLLIVTLTEEYEGGSNKCSAYWKPGVYMSGRSKIEVEVRKEEELEPFVLRSFVVTVEGTRRHVLQIQLNKWVDMSVAVDPRDILAIVSLKNLIVLSTPTQSGYSTITHCSAGCGRTGVFCAVDALISVMRFNNNHCELPYDPVYELVNNLRRQRILMVQTMRQYCLVYDVLAQYALGNKVKAVCELAIVQDFLEQLRN